jgi:predicted permease
MKLNGLWRRYDRLLGSDPASDVKDELRFHIESKFDDLVDQGWQPEAARQEAARQFGALPAIEEIGIRIGDKMDQRRKLKDYWSEVRQDVRFALRTLDRDRGFTLVAVLILALGIGANISVFSVVNTILLRPLPFPDAHQLAWLTSGTKLDPRLLKAAGLSGTTFTVSAFEEFQRHNKSFQSVTSYNPFFGNSEYILTGRTEPRDVAGVMVAGNFFQTLGVRPALGRLFINQELQKDGPPAVLLSNVFWRREFAGNPAIVGQNITLSKQSVTVVGVLPPEFDFGSIFSPGLKIDVFLPAVMDNLRDWGNTLAIVARLKSGVSVAQAQNEADVLFPALKASHADWEMDYSSKIDGLRDIVSGKLRQSVMALWCAVGLVLVIVCVNLSSLLVARAAARRAEFAMRLALGAGRGRLIRQLLTESLVLAAAGAVLGLSLAFGFTFYLARQDSIALPLLRDVRIDGSALLWTLVLTGAVTLLFGLVPALRLSASNLQGAMKENGRSTSAGSGRERLHSLLVITEVALACVLLVGAGLLLRSFVSALHVDMGFQPSRAAVVKLDYEGGNDKTRRAVMLQEILRRIDSIPGVEASGVADMLPLGRNRSWQFAAKGNKSNKSDIDVALVRIVTPGYLNAMGMHLREGRDFSWQDSPNLPHTVIINLAAARHFWPGKSPLGRIASVNGDDAQVVGVISDVRQEGLEISPGPEAFLPVMQSDPEGAELVVRTSLPPSAISSTVLATLRSLNPAQPAYDLQPLQEIVDHSVSPRRFFLVLLTSFAALGLFLAALGIYGVISYSVTRRTQEIGIRMALGASVSRVVKDVLFSTFRVAGAGIALGTAASLGVARLIASLLFNTSPSDAATYSAMVVVLFFVALVAGYIPARRAARINPTIALRAN